MKKTRFLILAVCLNIPFSVYSNTTGVFSQPLPDTKKFRCKYCPLELERRNTVDVGIISIVNNNSKFSEYRGQGNNVVSLKLDADYGTYGENKKFSISTKQLGNSNREVDFEAIQYGDYQLNITFNQLTRFQSDSGKTIYSGVGTNDLKNLNESTSNRLNDTQSVIDQYGLGLPYDVKQKRNRFNVTFKKILPNLWESRFSYRFERKIGLKTFGGAFNGNYTSALSVILPEPIDYTTQLFKLSLGYYGRLLKMETGVKVSLFKNTFASLSWDNLYLNNRENESLVGQSALDPDNRFLQFYALGQFRPVSWLTGKGQVSVGRSQQNQRFLPYTVNENIELQNLPASSLDGSVDSLTGNMRLTVKPRENYRIYADVRVDRKDNKTASRKYQYVSLDSLASADNSRFNSPYGYRLYSASIASDYYYHKNSYASLGYKYQQKSRSFSEIGLTKTRSVWAKIRQRFSQYSMVSLKLENSERKASDFSLVSKIEPPQNPLMRKYYLADKQRQKASIFFSTFFLEDLSVDLNLEYARDDFHASVLGVIDASELAYGIDIGKPITEYISTKLFFHKERITSLQKGIDFNLQNWQVNNIDSFTTLGIGIDWRDTSEKYKLGSTLIMALSSGDIEPTRNNTQQTAFPTLETNRITSDIYGVYTIKDNLSVKAQYLLEYYQATDWHIDDVNATSLGRVLGTQEKVSNYTAHMVVLSGSYVF